MDASGSASRGRGGPMPLDSELSSGYLDCSVVRPGTGGIPILFILTDRSSILI